MKNRIALGGIAAVLGGFALDLLSNDLARKKVLTGYGDYTWSASGDPVRAQAVSHLGFALMLFGFVLIAMTIYRGHQAESIRTKD